MLLTLMKTLIALYGGLSETSLYPADFGPNLVDGDQFDFIVVGGGSAGSLIANRLSAIPEWKVLLLEAGGYPSDFSEVPGLTLSLQGTDEDWKYLTEPSSTCCFALRNGSCRSPRGKGLGGSSLINFMMYTRSTRYDHDLWVKDGNVGWDYETVLKYYKKFENAHVEDNVDYGEAGELHLSRYKSRLPIRDALGEAYEELGYSKYTEDVPVGYRDVMLTLHKGVRQNAAKAFLSPVKDRRNLYVALNCHVTKLVLEGKVAKGVIVKVGERLLELKVAKEVILSAGSINSPQILMNSGIGHGDHLTKLGIKLVHDLSVGDNYKDHVALPGIAISIDHPSGAPLSLVYLTQQLYDYFWNRQGDLAEIQLINFSNYIVANGSKATASIQVVHAQVNQQDPYMLQETYRIMGLPEDAAKILDEHSSRTGLLVLMPYLLHPKSSGRIRLRDSNPFSPPLIFPDYFTDERDVQTFLEFVQHMNELLATKSLAPFKPKLVKITTKKCEDFPLHSEDYWRCVIKGVGLPLYHPVGTCKMGPKTDPSAVVDPELRVHGIERLRVIDASVMPRIPSCNTNAPTFMIAERGAELVREAWKMGHDEL